nr:MAG TPA: hypothetical protein [Caudoviricetes sp.]
MLLIALRIVSSKTVRLNLHRGHITSRKNNVTIP